MKTLKDLFLDELADSVIAAEIIRDCFLGRVNHDAHLFRFGR